ncbi:MAG: DUF2339 domain-containing protein [Phycisphaerales bacterium]|jgi:uncharacterized membrane protein
MADMPHDDARRELSEVRAQLRALQHRLDAIETRLASEELTTEEPAAAEPPVDEPAAEEPRAKSLFEELREKKMAAASARDDAPPVAPAPPLPVDEHEDGDPEEQARRAWNLSELEWLVGAKGIVLAGVLVLVIAAGFFLKEAWDRGWVDQVPGWVRCALGAAFGIGLVAVGEVFRRRINDLASSGVSAAGLAVVFGSILAAARIYELMPIPVAFVLLALTSLSGVLLGALSNRVLLSGLSLIGAFVVPLVVRTDSPSYVALPAYLLALLAMGLVLAGWKGHGFAIIRRLAWWGTAVMGTLWGLSVLEDRLAPVVVFASLVWAMTIAELYASARFFARLRPSVDWPDESSAGFVRTEPGEAIRFDLLALWTPEARWINSVFGVTVWAVVLMAVAVHEHAAGLVWVVPGALMLASIAVALASAPGRSLWTNHPSARSALATALVIDAAALLAITIATGLGGAAEVITWALVGLAAVAFGVRVRFAAASVLGLLFMGFGLARVVTFDLGLAIVDLQDEALASTALLGLRVTSWSAQVFVVSAAIAVAAFLLRRSRYRQATAITALAAAAFALIGPGSEALSLGAAWAIVGVLAAHGAVAVRRLDLRNAAAAILVLGTGVSSFAATAALKSARLLPADVVVSWTDASWSLLFVGLAWIAASGVRRVPPVVRMVSVGVALAAFAEMLLGDGTPFGNLVVGWSLLVAGVSALAVVDLRVLRSWLLAKLSCGAALLMAAIWVGHRVATDWGDIDAVPLLHRAIASGFIVMASLLAVGWRLGRSRDVDGVPWDQAAVRRALRRSAFVGVGVLGFVLSSSEVYRSVDWMGVAGEAAPNAALSVWWALYAVATIALGVRLAGGIAAVRWAGLALLGVTAIKAVLLDMAALDGLTRIIGSAVVGLILLGAGVGYAAMMGRVKTPRTVGSQQGGTTPDDDTFNRPNSRR